MPSINWIGTRREFMLICLYPYVDDTRVLADFLRVPYESMKSRASVLKLRRLVPSRRATYSLRQKNYVKRSYLTVPPQKMADHLGKSEEFVKSIMRHLELVIPREIIEQRIIDSRIKPGNVPANKGRKQSEYMTKAAIARTKATRFKKGQLPHNAIGFKDGDISIRRDTDTGRPYLYVRLSLGKWYPLHQHVWEKHNGKVPRGHCLWFKDNDSTNCTIENLEMISRAENAKRNSGSRRLTDGYVAATMAREKGGVGRYNKGLQQLLLTRPDLIDLKRQSLLLKRSIHEQRDNYNAD